MPNTKFRGKVYHYGNDCGWVYGDFYHYYNGNSNFTITNVDEDEMQSRDYNVDICTVSQWSGLMDKNGKEIFSGDIIQFEYNDRSEPSGVGKCNGVVSFENGCFVCRQIGFNYVINNQEPETLYRWISDEKCKIIGNKYDNPELLNGL